MSDPERTDDEQVDDKTQDEAGGRMDHAFPTIDAAIAATITDPPMTSRTGQDVQELETHKRRGAARVR